MIPLAVALLVVLAVAAATRAPVCSERAKQGMCTYEYMPVCATSDGRVFETFTNECGLCYEMALSGKSTYVIDHMGWSLAVQFAVMYAVFKLP